MKTKIIIIAIGLLCLSGISKAQTYYITQNEGLSLTSEYINNMSVTWYITSTVSDKPLIIYYSIGTEKNYDFLTIYSIDGSGTALQLQRISGTENGSISIPTGKAKITFTTDGSVCYANNPSVYFGLDISFAVANPFVINNGVIINGDATIPTEARLGTGLTDAFHYDNRTMGHYSLGWFADSQNISHGPTLWLSSWGGMKFFTLGSPKLVISPYGNIGIGTTTPYYKLDVQGIIRAHEIRVNLNSGADFVFEPNYALMPLGELDKFIKTNRHLPEIAPAAVMEAEGIDLSDMNAKLLQKVEELTLYVIELQKQINEMKSTQ